MRPSWMPPAARCAARAKPAATVASAGTNYAAKASAVPAIVDRRATPSAAILTAVRSDYRDFDAPIGTGIATIATIAAVRALVVGAVLVMPAVTWAATDGSPLIACRAVVVDGDLLIWQSESQLAWEYRADRWARAATEAPEGCPIKGNISKKGERIYHAPWSPAYAKTRIDESRGERCFCDEVEAIAAGWRAARWR